MDLKFPIIVDNHVHEWKEFAGVTDKGINTRLLDTLRPWDVAEQWMTKHDAKFGVMGGDLFHQRNVQRTVVGVTFYERYDSLRANVLSWRMIPGNHDQSTRNGEIHSLVPLRPLAHVYDAPYRERVGDVHFAFLPYMDKPDDVKAALKELKARPADARRYILISHLGVQGAVTGSFEFVPPEQIEVKDFPKTFDAVLLGHYHKRQVLQKPGNGKPLVMYCGSPLQHTKDDADDLTRGVTVFNTGDLSYEVLKVPAPRFVTMPVGGMSKRECSGNFIYLKHGANDDVEGATKAAYQYGARGVKPVAVGAEGQGTAAMQRRGSIAASDLTDDELISEYVEQRAPVGADKKALINIGRELLHAEES